MAAQPGTRAAAKRRTGCLGWLARALFWLLVLAVVLGSLAAGAATIFVQRTLPLTSGTLAASGLDASVTVIRDRWGVPHITASTEHDLAFAQGYVTAQDRLFQMEVNRRVAEGRLAEIFGRGPDDSVLDLDRLTRTLDLYSAAAGELATTDAASRATLAAYADGVNAFVRAHRDRLPLEFTILGFAPEPWRPVDTLAFGRVEALTLDSTWQTKYSRALLLGHGLDDATLGALFPSYPLANPTLLTIHGTAAPLERQPGQGGVSQRSLPSASAAARLAFARLSPAPPRADALARTLLGGIADSLGSNDWVVDGTRTASGKPLLANDPHLGISEPAIWYEVALRSPQTDVIGFSFPGTPGVIIGHNRDIAWGMTNVGADNADLYMETLDPSGHPGQYEYMGTWLPLVTRQESVRVRGEARPITFTVRATQHGPLLNDAVSDLKGYATPVALKWTALQPGYQFAGFFQLDQATGWASFQTALRHISISQNFVFADTAGNIGYQMSGLLPIRSAANDTLPVPGDVADHEWLGYVPFSQMPSLFDPPTHVIATANNQIVPTTFPVYVASSWDAGFRARRIVDQLAEATGLTTASYAALQSDVYAIPAATLAPIYAAAGAAAGADGADGAVAAKMLGGWDDRMTRDSAAAALYEVTTGMLARDLLEPVAGKPLYAVYRSILESSNMQLVVMNLLAVPRAPFFGASTDAQAVAARDAAVARALKEALASLRAAQGNDPTRWRWGALHQAHFAHPLASVAPLNLAFDIAPVERPGDSVTVDVGGSGGFSADPASYGQRTIPSMREIIDLSNFDASLWVIPAGESGQPYSPHYADLLPLWNQGRYQAMAYSAEATARIATDVLTLTPA